MAELDFDLFGDAIPEGFGRRGRPPHVASDRNRNKVMVLLACGWTDPRIARTLGVSLPTLRKHYFFELRGRDAMRDRLKASHFQSLVDEMKKGNVAAAKEVGRLLDRLDAASFGIGSDPDDDQAEAAAPGSGASLGKKERAQLEAKGAGAGTDWGSDLLPPQGNA